MIVLAGAIAALSGLGATTLLRRRRCDGAGGQWLDMASECRLPSGDVLRPALSDAAVGLLVALAAAFVLFRVLLFATGRMRRRVP